MTHLFETLLTNGLRVDLHLEDDRIRLTNETPHLARMYPERFVLAPVCLGKARAIRYRRGLNEPTNQTARRSQNFRLAHLQRSLLRIRSWSATGLARDVFNHNRLKTRTRAQLSPRPHTRSCTATTCSRSYYSNASRRFPFLVAEWHTY